MKTGLVADKFKRVVIITFGVVAALTTVNVSNFVRAAEPRPLESSRIVELFDKRSDEASVAGGRPLDLSGYRRPDIIGYIYEGKFELVPATGLDNIRYYAQAVADLAARCPSLGLDAAKHEIIPFLLSGVTDLVRRFQTGQLSQSEVLQAAWMAMLGLNQHWSCQYTPGRGSFDQAQAQCNQAGQDRANLGVLPSLDAAHDTTLFLGRYGCKSTQAQRLARQLIAFGRIAHTRMHFTERMPSPTSPAGKAYGSIFENCARGSLNDRAYAWCGCYVRTLHSLKPSGKVLRALAQNPFIDGSTYMSWVARNVPGGNALYKCESTLRGKLDWRESYAPRTTACLIDQTPAPGGAKECRYRAACGVFSVSSEQCARQISSRRWGYREVDCNTGGAVPAPRVGPREWQKGIFTLIDYETQLAPDFVPPLPADARAKHPLQVRLLKRDTPGLLKSMSLAALTYADLMTMGMPLKLLEKGDADLAAIDREGTLILKCAYKTQKSVATKIHWFERVPKHVQNRQIDPALRPYFAKIAGAVADCPARY